MLHLENVVNCILQTNITLHRLVDPARQPLIIHKSCIPEHLRSTDVVVTSEATNAAGDKVAEEVTSGKQGVPEKDTAQAEKKELPAVDGGSSSSSSTDGGIGDVVEVEGDKGSEDEPVSGGLGSRVQVGDFLEGRMPLVYFELIMLAGVAASVPVMLWRKRKYMRF